MTTVTILSARGTICSDNHGKHQLKWQKFTVTSHLAAEYGRGSNLGKCSKNNKNTLNHKSNKQLPAAGKTDSFGDRS